MHDVTLKFGVSLFLPKSEPSSRSLTNSLGISLRHTFFIIFWNSYSKSQVLRSSPSNTVAGGTSSLSTCALQTLILAFVVRSLHHGPLQPAGHHNVHRDCRKGLAAECRCA